MFVVHIITGLNNGGAEAVLYRLCKNDEAVKHTVISMMDKGKYGIMLEENGVEVYCLNMPQGRVTFSGVKKLYGLLKELKPDVVQTWMYHADLIGGTIARLAGFKSVFWNVRHSILEKGSSKRSTILIAKLCAILSNFIPKKIICCAQKALEVHSNLGYQRNKMVVIGNGYKLDTFRPSESDRRVVRDELSITSNMNVVGMVGRFDPQKDHANLLSSISLVKQQGVDFKCLLVGADLSCNNTYFVNEIKKLGLYSNVVLLEQRDDIPAIMNALDVHLLSSFSEGFPNVLCEAMACGTPCVTTDVGDAALIVSNTGWVVPSRNAEDLAAAIVSALNEKEGSLEVWSNRKEKCRKRVVENFGIEEMIEKYHAVWQII